MLGKLKYTKLTKPQLDTLTTTCGAIVAIAEFLYGFDVINKPQAFFAMGAATLVWSWFTNRLRPPSFSKLASMSPMPFTTIVEEVDPPQNTEDS